MMVQIVGIFPRAAMGRPPKLADESFLPGLSSGEIGEMYKAEKDGRDMQKMLVAYNYKSGKSIEATEATCTDPETARRWIVGMRKRSEAALRHRKAPGPLGYSPATSTPCWHGTCAGGRAPAASRSTRGRTPSFTSML